MKRLIIIVFSFLTASVWLSAQSELNSAADSIIGIYEVVHHGEATHVSVFKNTDGTYSFKMPSRNVSVSVEFKSVVAKDSYTVNSEGDQIEIEVGHNIDFDIEIANDWITKVETRAFVTETIVFNIAKHTGHDNREGTIIFKSKDGKLSQTVKVYQAQEDALIISKKDIVVSEDAIKQISRAAAGDVRRSLNMLELCVMLTSSGENSEIFDDTVEQILSGNSVRYDREGDEHYDIVSAYQKSMRGSDPDAALHYLARLLAAGDMPSACRRLLVCANEDVGLAYPQIIPIVKSCTDIAMQVGLPEARIILAKTITEMALSPKSNSAYLALDEALNDVRRGNTGNVPNHIKTSSPDYKYAHDYPGHFTDLEFMPEGLVGHKFYEPADNRQEETLRARLESLWPKYYQKG